MTLLYSSPMFLEHLTGEHPERPERLLHVTRHLERTGLDARCTPISWAPATVEELSRVHDPGYIQSIESYSAAGGGRIEEDTVCSPLSYEVGRLAAGAAADAVRRVVAGEDRQALCLVRPPGHHALADSAMGFCLFGTVALAAKIATTDLELSRVLVVDWDVHHGNGTQAMCWEDPTIGFLSIHRWPFYPGTGDSHETGSGRAVGTKMNLPIEFGTSWRDYHDQFLKGLDWLASRMRPELVLISAGFDAHRDDPIGSLGLDVEDFGTLTRDVLEIADSYAGGRVVSVLEGGYNTGILAGCVAEHLTTMLDWKQRPVKPA